MASDDQKGDNLGLTLGLGTLREKEAVIRLRRKAGELVCVQPHNQKLFLLRLSPPISRPVFTLKVILSTMALGLRF